MTKKSKKNVMELFQTISSSKSFKRRRERKKTKPYLKLHLLRQCAGTWWNVVCFLPPTDYLEDYIDLVTQLKLRQKSKCQYEFTNLKPITELRKWWLPRSWCNWSECASQKTWQEIVDTYLLIWRSVFMSFRNR
jgi:hypothetical protein